MESIENRVKKVIGYQLSVHADDVKPENSLTDDLGADSLDQVELVMALEDEFEIEIPDDDGDKIKTVQQAIDYITGKVPA